MTWLGTSAALREIAVEPAARHPERRALLRYTDVLEVGASLKAGSAWRRLFRAEDRL